MAITIISEPCFPLHEVAISPLVLSFALNWLKRCYWYPGESRFNLTPLQDELKMALKYGKPPYRAQKFYQ